MSKSVVSYDPETLREVVSDPDVFWPRIAQLRRWIDRQPPAEEEMSARCELVVLLRMLGDLDSSLDEARTAVERAAVLGGRDDVLEARLRLAHTYQWRGEFIDSTLMFIELLQEANTMSAAYDSAIHEQAGKNYYEQGLWSDAYEQFQIAMEIEMTIPERTYRAESVETLEMAIAAARRHLAESE
jgi:tetratricopeptide (TPR) repeat protein